MVIPRRIGVRLRPALSAARVARARATHADPRAAVAHEMSARTAVMAAAQKGEALVAKLARVGLVVADPDKFVVGHPGTRISTGSDIGLTDV